MNVATTLAELINKTTNHSQIQPSIWCVCVSTNSTWLIHSFWCAAQSEPLWTRQLAPVILNFLTSHSSSEVLPLLHRLSNRIHQEPYNIATAPGDCNTWSSATIETKCDMKDIIYAVWCLPSSLSCSPCHCQLPLLSPRKVQTMRFNESLPDFPSATLKSV